jgi:hypothetical protein
MTSYSTAPAPDDKRRPSSRRLEREALRGFGDAQPPAANEDVHMRDRLAECVYFTTTETRTTAGRSLRSLGPEILYKNWSCPLYPRDDLYVTSG